MIASELLSITNLDKSFYHRPILKDFNLQIAGGEIVAVMGRNGVGKSTLFRVLARISSPVNGEITFQGKSILKGSDSNRKGILYLGHAPGMYPPLSAVENLQLISAIYSSPVSQSEIMSALNRVGLTEQINDPIKIYSQGMLQRLKLALAILVDWKLLLFDEPFTGLDAQGRKFTEMILADWKQAGRTVMLVTHDFEWSWSFCTRIVILESGIIQYDFSPSDNGFSDAQNQFRKLIG